MRIFKIALLTLVTLVGLSTSLAAADGTIRGTVTDGTGKPVRGATVKAALGTKASAGSAKAMVVTILQLLREPMKFPSKRTATA